MSRHRRQGRAPSDAWWTLGELRRVLALVESGQESYSSLGRKWGVTQASISKAVTTAGLRRRSPRELALLYMIEVGPVSLTGLTEAFPAWSKDRACLALRQLRNAGHVRQCGHTPGRSLNGYRRILYRPTDAGREWLATLTTNGTTA